MNARPGAAARAGAPRSASPAGAAPHTPGVGRRLAAVAVTLVAALVVGLLTVAAFRADGYATTSVDLAQRAVWVTNGEKFMVGRINRQIDELDSAAATESAAIDVLQQGNTVVVVDATTHQARLLDTANVTLGGRLTLPAGAVVAMGGDQLAVADPASGAVWLRPTSGISAGDLTAEDPSARISPGAVLAVSADGSVRATAPGASTVTTLTPTAEGPAAAVASALPGGPLSAAGVADQNPVQLTMVGDTAIVLDRPAGRIIVGDKAFPLPAGTVDAVLQQPGPSADGVLVATDRALLRVALSDGAISTFDAGAAGTPTAPVWLGGCAHAAWAGAPATYLSWCGSVPAVRPIPGLGPDPTLKFRVNGDVVVLNDMTGGNTWLLDPQMTVVNNWDAVAPPKQQDAESSPDGEETASNQLTTSRTDCSGGMAPPQPAKDAFGVRAGRPTVLRVLDNDQTSNCSMVIVSKVAGLPEQDGTVAVVDDGQAVQITPAAAAAGPLPELTYTVDDGAGHTATSTIAVTVLGNENPLPPKQTRKSAVTVAVGGTATYNVLADWYSPSGDPLFLVGVSINNDDDQVTYRPDGTITVDDKGTMGTAKKTVTFMVSDGVNPPANGTLIVDVVSDDKATPVAVPVYATGMVGEPIAVFPLNGVTSPGTEPLRLVKVDPPKDGGLKVTTDLDAGQVTVIGAKAGTSYLTYQVAAGAGSAEGLIRVDVVNPATEAAAPVPMTDTAFLPVGGEVLVDLTANDLDPTGRALAVQQLTVDPNTGLVVTISDMHLVRISARRAVPAGGLWFSYQVSSGGAPAIGWVRVVSVPAPQDPVAPIASPIRVSVRAGDAVTIPMAGHAVDPGGDVLTVQPFDADTLGAGQGLLFTSGDSIRYLAPADAQAQTIKTTYTVVNRAGKADSAPLQITIVAVNAKNRAPHTPALTVARVFVGSSVDIPVPVDGIDPDGDWAVLSAVAEPPAAGRASVVGASTLRYTAFDRPGPDLVGYTVADPSGATASGLVKIVVVDRPKTVEPPVAPDIDVTVLPNRSVAVDVLTQVSDPAGYDVKFAATPLATRTANPGISYKVADGAVVIKAGKDDTVVPITYTVVNQRGLSAGGVLTVTVSKNAPSLPPTAADVFVTDDMVTADRASARVDVTAAVGNPGGLPADLKLSVPQISSTRMTVGAPRILQVPLTDRRQVLAYQVTNLDDRTAQAFVVVPPRDQLVQKADPTTQRPQQQPEPEPEPEVFTPTVRKTLQVDAGTEVTVTLADYIGGLQPGRRLTMPAGTAVSATVGQLTRVDNARVHWVVPDDAAGAANLTVTVTDGTSKPVRVNVPARIKPKVVPPPDFTSAPLSVEAGKSASIDLRLLVTAADDDQARSLKFAGPTGAGNGVTGSLSGSTLTVSAAVNVPRGTAVPLGVTVKDNANHTVPATIAVTVTGTTAPLASVPDLTIDDAVQGQPSTVNVLAGAGNPLDGSLRVVGADVTGGAARVSFSAGGEVTVTPAADRVGTVTVLVTVADASGDDSRNVQATITATVRGRPDRPATPKVVSVGDGQVVLQWTAPDDNGSPIIGYTVAASGFSQDCGKSPCQLTGLTNNTTYNFTVTAHNAVGDSDPSKAAADARPDTAPDSPAAPDLQFGDRQIIATWKAPGSGGSPITGYLVRISPAPQSGTDVVSTADTTATFGGLVNGTQYQITVVARNSSGTDSDPSPPATEIPATVPDTPGEPTVSSPEDAGNGGKVEVSWTQVNGNGDDKITYTVAWSNDQGDKGSIEVGPGRATSGTIEPITLGANYSATVTATNKAGSSKIGPAGTVSPYTAPAAIADLAATATGTSGQVTLNWSAPADNGRTITAYQYHTGDGQWLAIGPGSTSVTVDGLTDGQQYGFVVKACNTDGGANCGPASAAANGTPYQPPGVVTALVADASASQTVTLSWGAPGGDGGRPIAGYQYQVDTGGWQDVGTATTATVSGLTNGQQYAFAVRAYNAETASKYGAASPASQTPYDVPAAPTGLSASVPGQDGTISLAWTAGASNGRDIAGYDVSINGGGWTSLVDGAATSATVSGLANGTAYTFRVQARTAAAARNVSAPSNTSNSVAPYGPIAAPSITKSVSGTTITFTWSFPANGNGRQVGEQTVTVNGTAVNAGAGTWSENVGYSKTRNATIRFCVTGPADCKTDSASATTPDEPKPDPTIQIVAGGGVSNSQCNIRCNYIAFSYDNFSGGSYHADVYVDDMGSVWRDYDFTLSAGSGRHQFTSFLGDHSATNKYHVKIVITGANRASDERDFPNTG